MGKVVTCGSRNPPCQICGRSTHDCRVIYSDHHKYPLLLCQKQHIPKGTKLPGIIPGTYLISAGPSPKSSVWTQYIQVDHVSECSQKPYAPRPTPPKQKFDAVPDHLLPEAFEVEAKNKDREWRRFVQKYGGLPLQQEEIAEMHRRGVSAHLCRQIPFIRTYNGLGIPVQTPEGEILAYQERNLRNPNMGRYKWLLVKSNPQLAKAQIAGRVPPGFYGDINADILIICEGYLKAAVTFLKYRISAIGIGGHGYAQQSYPIIRHYLKKMPHLQTICIAPDKDVFTNITVQDSIKQLFYLLSDDWSNDVVVCTTWQDHDRYDIDEIPTDPELQAVSFEYYQNYLKQNHQSTSESQNIDLEK